MSSQSISLNHYFPTFNFFKLLSYGTFSDIPPWGLPASIETKILEI